VKSIGENRRNRGKMDNPDTETEAKWITLTHIYMTDTETEAKWINRWILKKHENINYLLLKKTNIRQ
jgi:hypothetical protein